MKDGSAAQSSARILYNPNSNREYGGASTEAAVFLLEETWPCGNEIGSAQVSNYCGQHVVYIGEGHSNKPHIDSCLSNQEILLPSTPSEKSPIHS